MINSNKIIERKRKKLNQIKTNKIKWKTNNGKIKIKIKIINNGKTTHNNNKLK